jgi:hypothetical protein
MLSIRNLVPAILCATGLLPLVAAPADEPTPDNQLTAEEKDQGWLLLFNGQDYSGWKCNNGKEIQSQIEDGAMQPHGSGGYLIIYEKPFSDFILKCDVKMSGPPCNSGIFFRVGDPEDPVYTGFEIQVQTGKGTGMHDFGSIYDLVAPSKNASKGGGEWNQVEIRCQGPEIAVKVNGEQVARMNVEDFDKPGLRPDGSKHKFRKAIKDFPREGYLGFQDHGQPAWFKNVKLLELTKQDEE